MGRMHTMILMIVVIELALFMFSSKVDIEDVRQGNVNTNVTAITSFLLKPTRWNLDVFFSWLKDNKLSGIIAGGIVVGAFYLLKDFGWRAGVVFVFIGFGAVLMQLFTFIYANFPGNLSLGVKAFVAFILTMPLIIYYIIGIIDYVSNPAA